MDDNKIDVTPAEAIFAFMGWLTSRSGESGPFSAHHVASQAAELAGLFCDHQGWTDSSGLGVRPGFPHNLRTYPTQEEVEAAEAKRHSKPAWAE